MRFARSNAVVVAAAALMVSACAPQPGTATSDIEPIRDAIYGGSGFEQEFERSAAIFRATERAIDECMALKGFEYTPQPPESSIGRLFDLEFSDPEFVDEYGWGMTTDGVGSAYNLSEDPNEERVLRMSEAELRAYNDALFGEVNYDSGTRVVLKEGCTHTATPEMDRELRELEELLDRLADDAAAIVRTDPAVAEIDAKWSACMGDAGFEFDSVETAQASIWRRYTSRSGAKVVEPLGDLQADEVRMAVASRDCFGDDIRERDRIRVEVEQRLLDEHDVPERVKALYVSVGYEIE
jgi:hypothetical protein